MPATGNVLCFFLNRNAHGARGETSLFPPWAPFSPVCYMEACGARCGLEVTALGTHGLAPCVRVCTGMLRPQYRLCAMRYAHGESTAHGARGETSLFPPWTPFSPVCYMEACGARYGFFKLPRSPRRLRQRGGLNARCHSASQNIFCDVAAFAAIPSLGPCALGTHGLAPCVRNCTGIFCPFVSKATADHTAAARCHRY